MILNKIKESLNRSEKNIKSSKKDRLLQNILEKENFQVIGIIIGEENECPTSEEIKYVMEWDQEKTSTKLKQMEENKIIKYKDNGYTITDKTRNIIEENQILVDKQEQFKQLYNLIEKNG